MGSRIMHIIIANQIANHFSIIDKASFLLGGIAPDAVTPKDRSHFFVGDVSNYSRSIDFEKFLHKYRKESNTPFILGYYTHLIADDIWLKGFYLPWLKNRLETDKNIFNLYHNDFRLLNGKLLNYYGLKTELQQELQKNGEIIELQEVTFEQINKFISFVLDDVSFEQNSLAQPLDVFTFEQIIGYVETSVEKGIMHVKSLLH
ncbi:zinc dependent phospholipase C family protein [Bacillus sp. Bva_UNVM-123]|uniref:zinc dependent phospholipase C family protein n=1 Tax=Bacillus sp. Bva_UNVM-123 TaxID=2829798 RepID=UPI00391FA2AB